MNNMNTVPAVAIVSIVGLVAYTFYLLNESNTRWYKEHYGMAAKCIDAGKEWRYNNSRDYRAECVNR